MDLIVIPCYNTKNPGGQPTCLSSVALSEVLGKSAYSSLLAARRELALLLGLAPGLDLGFETHDDALRFMPADQRYNGILYGTSRLRQLFKPNGNRHVVIISALYGLLDAADPIRDYNIAISDALYGRRLHTWWEQRSLGKILCEYTQHILPKAAFDLLSGAFRKAIKPWPECLQNILSVQRFTYPGQGTGSNYRRGEDLEKLLRIEQS